MSLKDSESIRLAKVKPVQHTPQRIAVTLHQEVKEKLVELEKKCIITKETVPNDGLAAW